MRLVALRPAAARLAALAAAVLTGCAAGRAGPGAQAPITRVTVMGDSLADAGSFGLRFTIQGEDAYTFAERLPLALGLPAGCPYFRFRDNTFAPNPAPGCRNFAVGGGVINPAAAGRGADDPRGLAVQFAAAAARGGYAAGDLVLIDGGGNDAAALVTAWLAAPRDGGAAYAALLRTLLDPAQVELAMAGDLAARAAVGGAYATALAGRFAALIRAQVLAPGARRVLLLNLPDITHTPRFQAVLDGIASAAGAGASGMSARARSEALFKGWIGAFNAELARQFAAEARVRVVDLAADLDALIVDPARFGVTERRRAACPAKGVGGDGLPTYSFGACTEAALAGTPPAGASGPAWWRRWYFADGFHPTPYGHELAFRLVARTLDQAGWR